MTVHEHARRVLSAGVDGEATSDDVVLATAHVERCGECQRAAGGFARVVEAASGLVPTDTPAWVTALGDALGAQLPAPPAPADDGPRHAKAPAPARTTGPHRPLAVTTGPQAAVAALGVATATAPPPHPSGPLPPVPARPSRRAMVARVLSGVTWVATVAAACLLVLMLAAWARDQFAPTTSVPVANAATDVRTSATVTARTWAQAVAAGNADGAWSLLSPRARDAVGGRAGFDRRLPALRSRYQTLLRRSGGTERAVLLDRDDARVRSVVIMTGPGGGPAMAVPVVTAGGTSLVEPFEPELSVRVRRSGRDVLVEVRPPAPTITVVIDDGGPLKPALRPTGSERRQVATVRAELEPGEHVVVAAAIDDEGRIAATATVVRVR